MSGARGQERSTDRAGGVPSWVDEKFTLFSIAEKID